MMQSILRLPACLRRSMYLGSLRQTPLQCLKETIITPASRRSLSNAAPRKPTRLPQSKGKQPSARTSKTNTISAPVVKHTTPVQRPSLNFNEPVLLYRSPDHTTLYITAYFFGGLLVLGAVNGFYIQTHHKSDQNEVVVRKLPWYINVFTFFYLTTVAGMGLVLMSAPYNLIRSIRVLPSNPRDLKRAGSVVLQIKVKSPLPFQKSAVMEALPSDAFLDRDVASSDDVDMTSIPTDSSQAFTNDAPKYLTPKTRDGIMHPIDVFKRDVRRMFMRDGFARVHIEGRGNYKIDLQGCQMLNGGSPLMRLVQQDYLRGYGPVAWFKRLTG